MLTATGGTHIVGAFLFKNGSKFKLNFFMKGGE